MKEEDLNKVINILEQNGSEEDAYIEFKDDDIEGELVLNGNKDGLILYSKEILNVIKDFEKQKLSNNPDKTIQIDGGNWFKYNSNVLPYIKPIYKKQKEIFKNEPEIKKTFKERLNELGCWFFILLIVVCVLVGFFHVVDYFINMF